MTIEDLGSRHGCYVDGRLVTSAELRPGARLRLGNVSGVVGLRGRGEPLSEPLGHDTFMANLARAATEARFFDEPVSMLMMSAVGSDDEPRHVGEWHGEVQRRLRRVDLVGLYNTTVLEIIVPRADLGQAAELCESLSSSVSGTLTYAIATVPRTWQLCRRGVGALPRSPRRRGRPVRRLHDVEPP